MIFTYGQLYNGWKDTVPQNSDRESHVKLKYELEPRLTALLIQLQTKNVQTFSAGFKGNLCSEEANGSGTVNNRQDCSAYDL